MSLEARYILNSMEKDKEQGYITKERKFNSLFCGSLPYSLESIMLEEEFNGSIEKNEKDIQFTRALINVTFNSNIKEAQLDENGEKKFDEDGYVKRKTVKTIKEVRKELYWNGFTVDGIKYVIYKRSSSKARSGSVLFIKENMYKKMIKRTWLGLEWKKDEECDLASIKAYESLSLSGIEDVVKIPLDSIFIVRDIKKSFTTIASRTFLNNGKLETKTEEMVRTNDVFDGESLLDNSLFKSGRGMMLLRNSFFKSCAFNTNIQQFFKDNKDRIKDGKIKDMFGREYDISNIKLITTPNSLKWLKFSKKFKDDKECYEYWLSHINDRFGVCKSEKSSHYDSYNQLSYQMINSMPYSKEDILEIIKDELDYVMKLKSDIRVFRKHISLNDMSYSRNMIWNLLAINDDIQYTKMYKNFRNDTVNSYIKSLKKGKIKIPNTDYAVLCGNPYELLLHSIGGEITEENTLHKGKEIYCSAYGDGEELVGFRNPNICSGNVLVSKNVYKEEFKYFNFTKNIVIINSTDNDIYDRLQGCDLDSDTVLLTNHPVIKKRAKEVEKDATPVNDIAKGVQIKTRAYNSAEMAEIDHIISNNAIGRIVNLSQILNSYYWETMKNGGDKELLDILYEKISLLSSLSGTEIDKSKKMIDLGENIDDILDEISSTKYKGKNVLEVGETEVKIKKTNSEKGKIKGETELKDKMVRPDFFRHCAEGKEYSFRKFETPMDYLEEILNNLPQAKRTKTISISDVLFENSAEKKDANRHQISKIKELVKNLDTKIDKVRLSEEEGQLLIIKNLKDEVIEKISKMKVTTATVIALLKRIYGGGAKDKKKDDEEGESNKKEDKEIKEYGMLLLECLYKAKTNVVVDSFKVLSNKIEVLQEYEFGDVVLFGKKYKGVKA
jgi:ribosomal protein L12E/L44/L45/RPP1/RPP2